MSPCLLPCPVTDWLEDVQAMARVSPGGSMTWAEARLGVALLVGIFATLFFVLAEWFDW